MAANKEFLEFPPLPLNDPLLEKKDELLKNRGLELQFPIKITKQWPERLLETARIWNLNEAEFYFLEDDEKGPLSPRNELAALSMVQRMISTHDELQDIRSMILERLNNFEKQVYPHPEDSLLDRSKEAVPCTRETETRIVQWCKDNGVKSRVFVADFEGYGRGAAAITDIQAGDLVLEIPEYMIISEDVATESELGKCLAAKGDFSGETIAVLWSMLERTNTSSKFSPYFQSLPTCFNTGLSFGVDGLLALEGTLAFEHVTRAKEHLRATYEMLSPALSSLSKGNPEAFPENIFAWENFLWASELWYSNSIKVGFPDGRILTCLVPFLGFFNHSEAPHITHYSKLDPKTSSLKVHALRQCEANKQCFLSYGTLANADLLCFYGFVLKNNPYDTMFIDTEDPDAYGPHRASLCSRHGIEATHMLRAPWLSRSSLTKAGLPSKLLAALRLQLMEEEEAAIFAGDPRYTVVNEVNEANVMAAITTTLEMLVGNASAHISLNDTRWDVLLAMKYMDNQYRTIGSIKYT